MTVKFHIRNDGTVGHCESIMGRCPYGEHFDNKADAIHKSEEIFSGTSNRIAPMSRKRARTRADIRKRANDINGELETLRSQLDDVKSQRRRLYLESAKTVRSNLNDLMRKTIEDRRTFKTAADEAIMVAHGRDDRIRSLNEKLVRVADTGKIPISMYSDRSNLKSLRPMELKTVMRPSEVSAIRLSDTVSRYVLAESTVKSLDGKKRMIKTRLDPKRLAHNLGKAIDRRKLIAKDIEDAGRMDSLKDLGDVVSRSMSTDLQKENLKNRIYSTPTLRKAADDDVRLASDESSIEHKLIRSFNEEQRLEVALKAMETCDDVEDGIRSILKDRNDRLFRSDGMEFGPEGRMPDVHEWCMDNGIV